MVPDNIKKENGGSAELNGSATEDGFLGGNALKKAMGYAKGTSLAKRRRERIILILLLFGLLAGIVWGIAVGAAGISLSTVVRVILSKIPLLERIIGEHDWKLPHEVIILQVRLPRVLLAMLVGASLAAAGVIFQGLFKNPMADPYILGISSGAGLGASIAITFRLTVSFMGISSIPLMALIGGLSTALLVYGIAKTGNRVSTVTLLLSGIAVGTLLSAVISFLMYYSNEEMRGILFWLMGGFSERRWEHLYMILPYSVLGISVSLLFARDLNLMLLGEESAMSLGLDVERFKRLMLAVGCLMASSSVAVSGVIGFVGLVVPHIVRLIVGPDHRALLPISVLSGAIFMILCDTLARTIFAPSEIPVGIITSLVGGPFFIFLLIRRKRGIL